MTAGVYLHIPFCKSRCSYCDFATDVYRSSDAVERYVRALCNEISKWPQEGTDTVDTVYFGGGTPSLLTPEQVERILETVHSQFDVQTDTEITTEMNPATVTPETLKGYKSLGINRASFGVQTFNDRALKLLARGHDANDARRTFLMLRDAGFDNVSFDLIAGLPNQTLNDWEKNLEEAAKLSPEHLSLYLLEIHEGTPLAEQVRSGRQPTPDEDLAAQMYEMMLDKLAAVGYEQYEISNFSRPGYESRHNSKYWRLEPVYGFGVSAHSFDGRSRWSNVRDTAEYVARIERGETPIFEADAMTEKQLSGEYVFLNLRLTRGFRLDDVLAKFGVDLREEYSDDLREFELAGLIRFDGDIMRLTRKGLLFSNEVFAVFA
jgi:oxygen-independent coproporphyrinogen-3 oxidase